MTHCLHVHVRKVEKQGQFFSSPCFRPVREICSQALVQSIRMWTLMIYGPCIRCKRGLLEFSSPWGCDEISTNWQSADYWHCTLWIPNPHPWRFFFFFFTNEAAAQPVSFFSDVPLLILYWIVFLPNSALLLKYYYSDKMGIWCIHLLLQSFFPPIIPEVCRGSLFTSVQLSTGSSISRSYHGE